MTISESLKVDHEFLPSLEDAYDDEIIISIILDCFYDLNYIKQSIKSVIEQDYNNVELCLVDNGASDDISAFLRKIHASSQNTSLIIYKENQFSWSDREKNVAICWNAALMHCKGEIISHLGHDDILSKNYAGKMVKLFADNSNCVTAGPLPVSINALGELNKSSENGGGDFLASNNRPRYIEGKKVALDYVKGSPERMFGAPGEILAIRKSILLEYSGYEQGIDMLQILKYSIHGDIGFDPEATVFWRHHALQSNRRASAQGHIDVKDFRRVIQRSNLINIWKRNFSLSEVKLLELFFKNKLERMPLTKAQDMVSRKNFYGLFLVFFHTAREYPEMLLKTIFHSVDFSFKIIIKKLKAMRVKD